MVAHDEKTQQLENGATADREGNSCSPEQWNNRVFEIYQSEPTFVILIVQCNKSSSLPEEN